MPQRLIEVNFPLRRVSEESVREKNIRHGHISTLHIWWARRPLAASRAIALAALLPDPGDPLERERLLALVRDISPWEAVKDGDSPRIEQARALIREAFGGRAPKVLDPFAGGGAIPLEALRLGCETYALDYNPVAVLINKAVLEYPQRWPGDSHLAHVLPLPPQDEEEPPPGQPTLFSLEEEQGESPLLVAVRAWGKWVLEEARRELAPFYPPDPDGAVPVGYIWARTLPCQNPACGAEIPLMRQTWLAKKEKRQIALRLIPNRAAGRVDAEIVDVGRVDNPTCFDPDEGTVTRARVRCPLCGGSIDDDTTRRLFREGKAGQRMMVVVVHYPYPTPAASGGTPSPLPPGGRGAGGEGKHYRLPTEADLAAYRAAEEALAQKRRALQAEWGMDPVPDEPLPPLETLGFRVQRYGLTRWGDLFNPRQQLALITFAEKVREAHARMVAAGADPDFARAVATYLAIVFNRLADKNANLVVYNVVGEKIEHVFGRQALPMVWDYVEVNPFTDVGWPNMQEWVELVLTHLTRIPPVEEGRGGEVRWR